MSLAGTILRRRTCHLPGPPVAGMILRARKRISPRLGKHLAEGDMIRMMREGTSLPQDDLVDMTPTTKDPRRMGVTSLLLESVMSLLRMVICPHHVDPKEQTGVMKTFLLPESVAKILWSRTPDDERWKHLPGGWQNQKWLPRRRPNEDSRLRPS